MTLIYRYLVWAAVAMGILGVACLKTYIYATDHQRDADLAAAANQQQAVYERFVWNVRNGQRLAGLLLDANHIALGYYGQLKEKTANDRHPTVTPAPGLITAVPVLTSRSVGLWNCAWAGNLPGGQPGSGVAAGPLCPQADAEGPSPFDVRDALYSDQVNADICWADIRQLRLLIQYEQDREAHANTK